MCNWPRHSDLARFRSGVYLDYRGGLCTAEGLVLEDAAPAERAAVQYRDADGTPVQRDFGEFAFDRVHDDGTTCDRLRPEQLVFGSEECGHGRATAPRFRYLGPRFESWMATLRPWAATGGSHVDGRRQDSTSV